MVNRELIDKEKFIKDLSFTRAEIKNRIRTYKIVEECLNGMIGKKFTKANANVLEGEIQKKLGEGYAVKILTGFVPTGSRVAVFFYNHGIRNAFTFDIGEASPRRKFTFGYREQMVRERGEYEKKLKDYGNTKKIKADIDTWNNCLMIMREISGRYGSENPFWSSFTII